VKEKWEEALTVPRPRLGGAAGKGRSLSKFLRVKIQFFPFLLLHTQLLPRRRARLHQLLLLLLLLLLQSVDCGPLVRWTEVHRRERATRHERGPLYERGDTLLLPKHLTPMDHACLLACDTDTVR
jgi:hypothetical protein